MESSVRRIPILAPSAIHCRLLLAVTLTLLTTTLQAQSEVRVLDPPDVSPVDPIPDNTFVPLRGDLSAVGYLSGNLDRAHHFLRRLDLITASFNKWADAAVPVVGYLVDRKTWDEMQLPGLYGIPVRTGPTAIVVPTSGDAETVRMWRSILGVDALPLNPGVPLHGTADEAASLAIVDVLAQVEAARGFVTRSRLIGAEPWISELIAHLAARVLFAEYEPDKLGQIDWVYDQILEAYGGVGQDGQREFRAELALGEIADIERWLWYQGAFARGARVAHGQRGAKSIKALLKATRKSRSGLSEAVLRDTFPGIDAWLQTTFR